jgi:hypothetical protein
LTPLLKPAKSIKLCSLVLSSITKSSEETGKGNSPAGGGHSDTWDTG